MAQYGACVFYGHYMGDLRVWDEMEIQLEFEPVGKPPVDLDEMTAEEAMEFEGLAYEAAMSELGKADLNVAFVYVNEAWFVEDAQGKEV